MSSFFGSRSNNSNNIKPHSYHDPKQLTALLRPKHFNFENKDYFKRFEEFKTQGLFSGGLFSGGLFSDNKFK